MPKGPRGKKLGGDIVCAAIMFVLAAGTAAIHLWVMAASLFVVAVAGSVAIVAAYRYRKRNGQGS